MQSHSTITSPPHSVTGAVGSRKMEDAEMALLALHAGDSGMTVTDGHAEPLGWGLATLWGLHKKCTMWRDLTTRGNRPEPRMPARSQNDAPKLGGHTQWAQVQGTRQDRPLCISEAQMVPRAVKVPFSLATA